MFITDQRVLHIAHIFRLITIEFDQWVEGNEGRKGTELIKTARANRHWLCGPYLEIVSENTKSLWFRSRQARMRLYMRNAESVFRIINETMVLNTEDC